MRREDGMARGWVPLPSMSAGEEKKTKNVVVPPASIYGNFGATGLKNYLRMDMSLGSRHVLRPDRVSFTSPVGVGASPICMTPSVMATSPLLRLAVATRKPNKGPRGQVPSSKTREKLKKTNFLKDMLIVITASRVRRCPPNRTTATPL